MAEHTYKPGDVVAVKARYDASPISDIHRHSVVVERGHIERAYVDDDQLAPFLSVEDQSSLLRVVKAATPLFNGWTYSEGYYSIGEQALEALARAIQALAPEVLDRVARLSEGGVTMAETRCSCGHYRGSHVPLYPQLSKARHPIDHGMCLLCACRHWKATAEATA